MVKFAFLLSFLVSGSFSFANDLTEIAILGTNDIHGALAPLQLLTREKAGIKETQYEAGGASMISSYVKILRSQYKENFLWLDAGDEFQGSFDSNTFFGSPMVQFFNVAGLQGAAVGNHEFDFGLPVLKERMQEAHYPYLAANIAEKKTGVSVAFPNTFPSKIYDLGKIKVGVIGLTTLKTPVTTPPANVRTLDFQPLREATEKEARNLRKKGANIVMMSVHVGLHCDTKGGIPQHRLWDEDDVQPKCRDQDELSLLLNSLPKGTVDAVVSGHSHEVIHQWIAGVPVIQGGVSGRFLNVIHLFYDSQLNKLISKDTKIEGPIPVCSKVFKNQNDCNGDHAAPVAGRGPLISPTFYDQEVHPDHEIDSLLKPILEKSAETKKREIAHAAQAIEHPLFVESPLGNLLADAMRAEARADVALINSGVIRAPIEKGKIRYENIFNSFPFDNQISILQVTGEELKVILQAAYAGTRALACVSGLRLELSEPHGHSTSSEKWVPSASRLTGITLPDGRRLDRKAKYTLATSDFFAMGGDDMEEAMSRVPSDRVQLETGVILRDAVIHYLKVRKGAWNTSEHPLVDPKYPRLVFPPKPSKREG